MGRCMGAMPDTNIARLCPFHNRIIRMDRMAESSVSNEQRKIVAGR
jgi:hypothetical protein